MIWFQLFMWVASFVISDYFREKLPSVTAKGVGDFNIPTATEGRVVPIILGGRMRCNAPNCIWYGDFAADPVTVETGVIFTRNETVGYSYRLALQYALFKSQVAGITGVWIGDEEVYRGAPLDVVDVNRPDLFGGETSGGGFEGRIRLFNGSQTQAVSSYLASRLDPVSAYRGTAYVMITSIDETEGAVLGESNQLRHIRIEVQAYDTLANGGLNNSLGLTGDKHIIGNDSNPMSVAYELYTNTDWGRAFPPGDVDAVSFTAAAETCYNEGIGFSMVIDELTTTGNIQDVIEQHIDGYIGPNPITGKIEVALARQNYVLANEFQATPDNILEVKKWNRGDWSQTYNKIRVRYADRDKQWKDSHAVEVDSGNRIIQGRNRVKDLAYEGVHTGSVAAKMAARGKRSLSQPMDSGTLVLNREAYALRPGSVVSVTSPKIRGTNVPTRVTKVGVGNITMNSIEVEVVLDIFDSESNTVAAPPPSDFVPPVQNVVAFDAADQAAFETPWILMRYDQAPNSVPRISTLARRTGGAPTEYEVIRRTRATFGSGSYGAWESAGFVTAGFMTVGVLRNAEVDWRSGNGGFSMQIDPITGSLDGLIDTYGPGSGNAAGIAVISPGLADEEWVAFTSIVDDGTGVRLEGLYRGCMDSPQIAHSAGARIWFIWTGGLGMQTETYAPGSGVEMKLLPKSPTDSILEGGAIALPEVHILNTVRNARPLLPRSLSINGAVFPTVTVDADFVAQTTPTIINGLLMGVTPRMWNAQDVLWQVQGLDINGGGLALEDWSPQNMELEWWLYDLDTTPSPTRGVDEILTGSFNWDQPSETFILSRDDLINAGITDDFNARIEIETKHSPNGQLPNQISRVPMFFDFNVTGAFGGLFGNMSLLLHFDGTDAATTTTDESENAHTVNFNNAAAIDTAQSEFGGSSLELPASNDYVDIAAHTSLALGTEDFTIEFRVRPTTVTPGARIIYDQRTALNQVVPTIYASANQLRYYVSGADRITGGVLSAATWHTIAVSRVAGTTRMYLDGNQVGGNYTDANNYLNQRLVLGDAGDAIGGGAGFLGHIEEVRVLKGIGLYAGASYTVDTDEFFYHRVSLLAGFNGADAETSFRSEDRYSQLATFFGTAQLDTAIANVGTASLLLDGNSDYVSFPNIAAHNLGAEDFTIEGFMYWTADPTTSNQTLVGSYNANGVNQRSWLFGLSNNNLRFVWSTDGINNTVDNFAFNPVASQWYHVAICRDGSNLRAFVDGTQVGITETITGTLFASTEPLRIGAVSGASGIAEYMDGNIEEVRVTKGKALYTANFTAPSAEFPRI